MKEPKLDKQAMISFLGDVISTEIEKANDEIDTELIAECEAFLAELITDVEISDEQMQNNIAKIKSKVLNTAIPTPQKNHRVPNFKRIIAAVCAAVILLCAGATACAFIPELRDVIVLILKRGSGSEVNSGGVTYVNRGVMSSYDDIQSLIEAENLSILYPHDLPDGLTIKEVSTSGNESHLKYYFSFENDGISMVVHRGEIDTSTLSDASETFISLSNIVSYIIMRNEIVVSTTVHNGWTYYVTANTMEDIKEILQNLY